jgi:hypothetical protein
MTSLLLLPITFDYRSTSFSDILIFLSELGAQKLFDLSGKIALITGSVAGLGKTMAKALARQGSTIILNGRPDEHLETTNRNFRV